MIMIYQTYLGSTPVMFGVDDATYTYLKILINKDGLKANAKIGKKI